MHTYGECLKGTYAIHIGSALRAYRNTSNNVCHAYRECLKGIYVCPSTHQPSAVVWLPHTSALDACLQTVQAVCRTNSVTNHCFGKAVFYGVQHREHKSLIQVAHLCDKCRGSAAPMAYGQVGKSFPGKSFQMPG